MNTFKDYLRLHNIISIMIIYITKDGGARGVMVIVVRNGHGDTNSNPGQD